MRRLGKTTGDYLAAAILLFALPLLVTHELGHASAAATRRRDRPQVIVYFGGTRRSWRRTLWRITFSVGRPESMGWSPCCWWDWRGDSVRRKRLAIACGPLSDLTWGIGLFLAYRSTSGDLRDVFGWGTVVAVGLFLNNVVPIRGRSDGWYFFHLSDVVEHPPCRCSRTRV